MEEEPTTGSVSGSSPVSATHCGPEGEDPEGDMLWKTESSVSGDISVWLPGKFVQTETLKKVSGTN